jgi:hypothetical protein
MYRVFLPLILCLVSQAFAHDEPTVSDTTDLRLDMVAPPDRTSTTHPIAGRPYEEAIDVLERHRAAIKQLPGVQEVGLSPDGIAVYTDNPTALPSHLDGFPVIVFGVMGDAVNGIPHTQVVKAMERVREELTRIECVQQVVLQRGEGIAVLTDCPERIPLTTSEGIPLILVPPMGIAWDGFTVTQTDAIFYRAKGELEKIIGVAHVGLSPDGIHVFTLVKDVPLPKEFEGVLVLQRYIPPLE